MTARPFTFRLSVDRAAGSLERVLGVVRRRNLGIERLSVDANGEGRWAVAIQTAAPVAEADLALRQFAALIVVRTAHLDDASAT